MKKLGIKEGFRMCAVEAPDDYLSLLGPLPDGVSQHALAEADLDFVHLFATSEAELRHELERARGRIVQNGMIWISWPKKASGVPSDLDGNVVRGVGLSSGLVDVKVCAVDDTWSGLKFVIRREDRT